MLKIVKEMKMTMSQDFSVDLTVFLQPLKCDQLKLALITHHEDLVQVLTRSSSGSDLPEISPFLTLDPLKQQS